jgi:hypothetical protein
MAKARRQSNDSVSAVGDIVHSILTEAQFRALRGSGWILCDGRSIAGSKLATQFGINTAPDARGQFLRGKNNGRADGNQDPDGERSLGNFQTDAIRNITGNVGDFGVAIGAGNGPNGAFQSKNLTTSFIGGSGSGNQGADFNASRVVPTAADNRPKNIAVNIFIKIND